MRRSLIHQWFGVLLIALFTGLAIIAFHSGGTRPALILNVDRDVLPADGYAQVRIYVRGSNAVTPQSLNWQLDSGRGVASVDDSGSGLRLRAGVTPGDAELVASAPGFTAARVKISFELDPTDQFGDGMPDFLRLQHADDQAAFRRWFALLAESIYFQRQEDRPQEITDCAALIRFAYRESLRRHDGLWANQLHLPSVPNFGEVKKYDYPHTALGANLFRNRAGAFMSENITDGAFAQFADAESLRRFNSHFVSRDLRAALPGDLIFFRQAGHRMPFHTIIYLGLSNFDDKSDLLIYHTGPNEGHAGEIRRVTMSDLLQHPQAAWRPLPQNPAFLGIYRWNILREAD